MLAALLAAASIAFVPVAADTSAQAPQVYVRDAAAPAEKTDDGPLHDAGLRAPRSTDAPQTPLYAGNGDPIRVLFGIWSSAQGQATFEPDPAGTRVRAHFLGLVQNGHYSLFVRQVAVRRVVLTPLDLAGTKNNFTADASGNADAAVLFPGMIPAGAQVVLIYHSDATDHTSSPGDPYRNEHVQLIARVP